MISNAQSKNEPQPSPAEFLSDEIRNAADRLKKIRNNIDPVCNILKIMSNENRLMTLCLLCDGERSVSALENELALSQPIVSQHLGRLRASNLVKARRDGQSIYYSLSSEDVRAIVQTLSHCFG